MVHLTLAGVSGDGRRLLLVSDAGVEFTLDIDARLRAALRGEHASIGQLEITMESALRPRDIQARIRAGETPEEVAQAAQTTVDRILVYANPVLAERAHVADRAQRSSLRRRAGEPGARTLGEAVELHLTSTGTSPEVVEWDAWRREDGRWVLTARYDTAKRTGTGTFTFDAPGNYVIAEDADAGWLVGEAPSAREAPRTPSDDLEKARARRRATAPPEQLTLGDDAIDLVTEPAPVEAYLDDEAATTDLPSVGSATDPDEEAEAATVDEEPPESTPEPEPEPEPEPKPAPQKRPRKRGRASVPSWDEIMFGGKSE